LVFLSVFLSVFPPDVLSVFVLWVVVAMPAAFPALLAFPSLLFLVFLYTGCSLSSVVVAAQAQRLQVRNRLILVVDAFRVHIL
jgi:hypothetical protein